LVLKSINVVPNKSKGCIGDDRIGGACSVHLGSTPDRRCVALTDRRYSKRIGMLWTRRAEVPSPSQCSPLLLLLANLRRPPPPLVRKEGA
jgi:hypothetical protein